MPAIAPTAPTSSCSTNRRDDAGDGSGQVDAAGMSAFAAKSVAIATPGGDREQVHGDDRRTTRPPVPRRLRPAAVPAHTGCSSTRQAGRARDIYRSTRRSRWWICPRFDSLASPGTAARKSDEYVFQFGIVWDHLRALPRGRLAHAFALSLGASRWASALPWCSRFCAASGRRPCAIADCRHVEIIRNTPFLAPASSSFIFRCPRLGFDGSDHGERSSADECRRISRIRDRDPSFRDRGRSQKPDRGRPLARLHPDRDLPPHRRLSRAAQDSAGAREPVRAADARFFHRVAAISAEELTAGNKNSLQSTTFRAFEFYFVATGNCLSDQRWQARGCCTRSTGAIFSSAVTRRD